MTRKEAGARLEDLSGSDLYEGGYYSRPAAWKDRLVEPLRRLADQGRAKTLGRVGEGDRVLEVGSGDGRLLRRLQIRGAEVFGVEPSEAARVRAAERGIPVGSRLDAEATGRGPFDLIICWHVLEHLPDPGVDLARLAGMLGSDGRLVLSVPNLGSLQARIGGDSWFGQDVPRHLTHFTPDGVRAIAAGAGLEVTEMSCWSLEQNPFGMWQTLVNRASGSRDALFKAIKGESLGTGRVPRAKSVLGLILSPILLPVAVGLEGIATLGGRGGTLTATLVRADGTGGAGV